MLPPTRFDAWLAAQVTGIKKGLQTHKPARWYRWRTSSTFGVEQQHGTGHGGLNKVVRGKSNALFRRGQPELRAHGPAHPWVARRFRRPVALNQTTQNDAICMLHTRFQWAPDERPGMAAISGSDHTASQQGIEQGRIGAGFDKTQCLGVADQLGDKVVQRFSVFVLPDRVGVIRPGSSKILECLNMMLDQLCQGRLGRTHQRIQLCRGGSQIRQQGIELMIDVPAAQRMAQAFNSGGRPGPSQGKQFQTSHKGADVACFTSQPRKRVLQKSKQGNRGPVGSQGRCYKSEEGAGRCCSQDLASRIVDVDGPATQVRGNPARQIAVARH